MPTRIFSSEIPEQENKQVLVKGWVNSRRDHGRLIFIDLRDKEGIAQVVFTPKNKELLQKADTLRPEWVIEVRGKVQKRPAGMENEELVTGVHEVAAEKLEILAEAKTPPFDIASDGREIGEEHRLKYRYLDLRRPRMQKNLRMRSMIIQFLRHEMVKLGFVELETPYISKSTPEGARDYLVPARLHPGKFYALPQSPQQYKQLFMVAGFERYFQIARCFRDEDTRGDRQPEFAQLDLEISFTNQEEILNLIQEIYLDLVKTFYPEKHITRLDEHENFLRLTYKDAMEKYNSDKPDLRKDKTDKDELAFGCIVDFPAFEWKKEEKRWDAMHHPFTMPQVDDVEDFNKKFSEDPSKILAYQYDVVLNGYEIGGGSIRIHDPRLLERVFEVMGNKKEEIQEKFGHMLEAFEYGVPPHGGIAMGIDRLVAVLQNEDTIREVFAFPKTGDGRDLMMGAPSDVTKEQLKELHLKTEKKENRVKNNQKTT